MGRALAPPPLAGLILVAPRWRGLVPALVTLGAAGLLVGAFLVVPTTRISLAQLVFPLVGFLIAVPLLVGAVTGDA